MTDKRTIDALDVAERFANGNATQKELNDALAAAEGALARDAAFSAAWDAAWDAARDAAWDAARDAQCKKLIEMFLAEGKERLKK